MATESAIAANNCSHRIKRILKLYQESADRTLNGPVGNIDRVEVNSVGFGRPENQRPLKSRPSWRSDLKGGSKGAWKRSSVVLNDAVKISMGGRKADDCDIVTTSLEGQTIAGFIVGGERRLCMPQILSTVMRDFSADEVFAVCEELNVFVLTCEERQLSSLFRSGVLPPSAKRCGLVTFTNAERMCNVLLRRSEPVHASGRLPPIVIDDDLKIRHDCFGGCDGVFVSDAYVAPSAPCVRCFECGSRFSPPRFVGHSHSRHENRTFHWGFDPSNWRYYVTLSSDQSEKPAAQDYLDGLKKKFESNETDLKDLEKNVNLEMMKKKVRLNDDATGSVNDNTEIKTKWFSSNRTAMLECKKLLKQLDINTKSSKMALPLHLYTGSPVLTDPEQIVSYTDAQWNDRNFAPNVSLNPEPYKKLNEFYDADYIVKSEPLDYDDDEENAFDVKTSSSNWTSSSSSKSARDAATQLNGAVGDVSDDESEDETESVLSDNLPAINEDDDRRLRSQISAVMDARLEIVVWTLKKNSNGYGGDPVGDFISLQKQHLEMVTSLACRNSELFQKHRYLRSLAEEKLHAADEIRRNEDEESERLKRDGTTKLREATTERFRLMQQIEKLSDGSMECDWAAMAAKYKEEAEHLKQQLRKTEDENTFLVQQITHLQKTLDKSTATSELYLPGCVKMENGGNNNNGWHPLSSSRQGI